MLEKSLHSDSCLVDSSKTITFRFEGENYQGYGGDSIATALWRNGQKTLSRSFKYHRPRGIFSLTGQDANTLVQLSGEGNVPADTHLISEGMSVLGQHYYGSLRKDKLKYFNQLSRFLPVGFYYKAFYRRNSWDKFWGTFFRRFTGLGVIKTEADQTYYDKKYLFFDCVVVGAGIAGMQSALTLAQANAKVLLVEQNTQLGGSWNYMRQNQDDVINREGRKKLEKGIAQNENIKVLRNATCNSVHADNWLAIIQGGRLFKVRTKKLIIGTGTFEQPFVFRNNDLPGIMLSSAAQKLIKLYAIKPANVAVVLTTNDNGYGVALDLLDAGVKVPYVIDMRATESKSALTKTIQKLGTKILNGQTVYSAEADSDQGALKRIELARITSPGKCTVTNQHVECDLLCMSGSHMPAYQLPCQLGLQLTYDNKKNRFLISEPPEHCHLIGSINGYETVNDVIQDAKRQSHKVLQQLQLRSRKTKTVPAPTIKKADPIFPLFDHPKGKEFVDLDEDLQIADIINSIREGYEDIQLVKRFSTLGMGPSQGRFSAFVASLLVSSYNDPKNQARQVGVTTARPPFSAEKIGVNAGRSFFPEKHSNMHHRHIELGAQPLIAGAWIRPAYYGDKNRMIECVKEESLNVRQNVGIVDISTLGGIEIRGPDAANFINRMYTGGFLKQPVGKARYALLTNEAGIVIDDGVACRFAEQHYYVTATTGGVDNVYLQFLKWNAQWRLRVDIANATSAWCGVNIAGPNARKVLSKVCEDVDLSAEGFPYMGVRTGTVSGIEARLIRVGFVGELGYEIHAPQHNGEALWDSLMSAGKSFNIRPFGIEAQRLLRLEKGHIIIGQDTDSITYPEEVQMSWAVSQNKPFFVGQRSIQAVTDRGTTRKLIGFEVTEKDNIPKENHLCFDDQQRLIGRVTSCAYSATLSKIIGLAYLDLNHLTQAQTFQIRADNKLYVEAKVVPFPFYDNKNSRQLL